MYFGSPEEEGGFRLNEFESEFGVDVDVDEVAFGSGDPLGIEEVIRSVGNLVGSRCLDET